MRRIKEQEFVIFDVETTGLSYRGGDRIIEVAALKVKNGEVLASYETLIDPDRVVSYDAYLVNGISTEMLEGQPKASQILPELLTFLEDACMVGHNLRFDINFLNNELRLAGYPGINESVTLDTCRLAKGFLPDLPRYSLQTVAYYLGYRKRQQHRAMSDVEMTSHVLARLLQVAQNNNIEDLNMLINIFGVQKRPKITTRAKLKAITASLENKRYLHLLYRSVASGTTRRKVMPRRMLGDGKQSVLVAYCHLRKQERYFNVDNILSLESC